jgi:small-conductance mechanosensitive channel
MMPMGGALRSFEVRRLRPLFLLTFAIFSLLPALAAFAATGTPEAAANPLRAELDSGFSRMWGNLDVVVDRLEAILTAFPRAPGELVAATQVVLASADASLLLLAKALTVAVLALILPLALARSAVGRFQRWSLDGVTIGATVRRALLDVAALVLTIAVAVFLARHFVQGPTFVDLLGLGLVRAAVQWRVWMLPFLILLRPDEPGLRLLPTDDRRAREAYRTAGLCFALGFVVAKYLPLMVDAGMDVPSAQAAGLIAAVLIAIGALVGLQRFFAGAHGWRKLAGHFCKLMVAVALVLWIVGLSILRFNAYNVVFWAMALLIVAFIVERMLSLAIKVRAGEHVLNDRNRFSSLHITRRVLKAVAGAVVLVMLARSWLVDVLGIFTWEAFRIIDQSLVMTLAVLVLGYLIYELLGYWTTRRFGHAALALPGGHSDAAPVAAPTSRLSSIMPVLRGFFGVLIVATAVLLGLDHLGVNISPLIAGAGIFGLAFSFGSQALVRDIVSGIFFVADDAFRVGEYIQAGSHKGTVEKLSLRSVRVRHQNGQFHTIPYGQLGAVTNFSRDYSTTKFNLRLARDADVEKARKLAKKVGVELAELPEYADDFLVPLKMQGVADIEPTALLCRFKFTVKPGNQTMIQREAIKRLYRAFSDGGIEFASNAVVVQGQGGTTQAGPNLEAAGAAATTLAAPVQDQVA